MPYSDKYKIIRGRHRKMDLSEVVIFLLYALVTVLLCGNDGILRLNYPRWDSAWFFMAGKAWMEGLIPYVDFADSKGPLLWLIYGMGYIISPTSFKGIFLMEVLAYWVTFILIFKSALILTQNKNRAMLISFLMVIAYFFPVIHQEMRAEDFCNVLYALTLYSILSLSIGGNLLKYGLFMGLSVGSAFMIKYNIATILAYPPFFYLLIILFKQKKLNKAVLSYLSGLVLGFIIICFPFFIYFITNEIIIDFFKEYLFNAFGTIKLSNLSDDNSISYIALLKNYFGFANFRCLYILLSILAAFSTFFKIFVKLKWLVFTWFFIALFFSIIIPWDYYLFNLAIFWFFPITIVVLNIKYHLPRQAIIDCGCLILFSTAISNTLFFSNSEFYNHQKAIRYEEISNSLEIMSKEFQIKNRRLPKVAFFYSPDKGYTIKGRFLPGVKYWALQSTASELMQKEHSNSIKKSKPDFIIISEELNEIVVELKRLGYKEVYKFLGEGTTKKSTAIILVLKYEIQNESSN